MNIKMTLLAATAALSLGACNLTTSDYTGLAGTALGAGGGYMAGKQFSKRYSGRKAKLIQAGGAVGGGILGGLLGKTLGKPYENSNAIESNAMGIHQNSQGIQYLANQPKGQGPNGSGGPVTINNIYGGQGQGGMQPNCFVRNNYVICNSQ
jgi:hypothetical protein